MPEAGRFRYRKAGGFRRITAEELRSMESWKMRELTTENPMAVEKEKERD